MKHSLIISRIRDLEKQIFVCPKCKELYELRVKKIHNCPVMGFDVENYLNAKLLSVCEAPGVYKPHKGEQFIEKYEDFHNFYDKRIQSEATIGKRLFTIFNGAGLTWKDVQHFNVICCSPPNYRKPTIDEIENCFGWLEARMKFLPKLKVIVAFGQIAKTAIKRLKIDIPVISSFHPSYIWQYMANVDREKYIQELIHKIKNAV